MLSQKLHDAINAQINAELWSAYLYLAIPAIPVGRNLLRDL